MRTDRGGFAIYALEPAAHAGCVPGITHCACLKIVRKTLDEAGQTLLLERPVSWILGGIPDRLPNPKVGIWAPIELHSAPDGGFADGNHAS